MGIKEQLFELMAIRIAAALIIDIFAVALKPLLVAVCPELYKLILGLLLVSG